MAVEVDSIHHTNVPDTKRISPLELAAVGPVDVSSAHITQFLFHLFCLTNFDRCYAAYRNLTFRAGPLAAPVSRSVLQLPALVLARGARSVDAMLRGIVLCNNPRISSGVSRVEQAV